MKKKVVWLVVTGGMVATLLLTSCAPAAVKEAAEKVAPPKEKEEVVVPKEVVVPEKKGEWVKWTGTKLDGTVVEKMIEKPRYGGVLTMVTGLRTLEPEAWDGSFVGASRAWTTAYQVVETPLARSFVRGPVGTGDHSGLLTDYHFLPEDLSGALAESWELQDPQTLVFHVRKRVHWALDPTREASRLVGGREMTAEDVVFNWRRVMNERNYFGRTQPFLSDMKNVENSIYVSPTDKWAFVVKTQPRMAGNQLGYGAIRFVEVHAPEVVAKYKREITNWKDIVGTGPFILKDYVGASSLTYVRNPNYWGRDPFFPENQLPYIDTFKHLIIPDLSTRFAALRTGKIDTLGEIDAADAESLMKTTPEVERTSYVSNPPHAIYQRLDVKPFDDIKVRQALMMAINYRELVDLYYEGKAEIFSNPVAPMRDLADIYIPLEKLPESVRELYGYHPNKAKKLLAEAGYPTGFKTEILTSRKDIDLLSIIKEYWAKIGVDLKIDVRDSAVYTSMGRAKTFPQMLIQSFNAQSPYSMTRVRPGAGTNYSKVDWPLVMVLFNEVMYRYFQPEAKRALLKAPISEVLPDHPEARGLPSYIEYVNEQAWYMVLPTPYMYVLWQPWLKNFQGADNRDSEWRQYFWIDQELKKAMGR